MWPFSSDATFFCVCCWPTVAHFRRSQQMAKSSRKSSKRRKAEATHNAYIKISANFLKIAGLLFLLLLVLYWLTSSDKSFANVRFFCIFTWIFLSFFIHIYVHIKALFFLILLHFANRVNRTILRLVCLVKSSSTLQLSAVAMSYGMWTWTTLQSKEL